MGIFDFLLRRNRKEADEHQDEILDDNKESVLKGEEGKKESIDVSSNDMTNLSDEEFFAEMARRSENGDAFSMTDLGICYIEGKGIQKDIETGLYWTRKAAELEDPMGIHNMGAFYRAGEILPQNYELAMQYFLQASELGLSRSSNDIGTMYQHGHGVEQNYELAVEWYKKAMEQDNPCPLAYKNLAFMYKHGLGVKQDDFESIKLLEKGSQAGSDECEEILRRELFFAYIKGVSLYYGKDIIQRERGKNYLLLASSCRFIPAMKWALLNTEDNNISILMGSVCRSMPQIDYVELTKMFIRNPHIRNIQDVLQKTEEGVESGDCADMCYLALMKLFIPSLSDYKLDAIEMLKASAQGGYLTALFWLGYCYEQGLVVEQNLELAKVLYIHVIKQGYSECLWLDSMSVCGSDEDRALAESHLHLSQILYNEGKYDEALSVLASNYGECKNHVASAYQYAKVLLAKGELEEANKCLYLCVKDGHDIATFDIAKLFLEKNDTLNFEDFCIRAIMLGNIDAAIFWQHYIDNRKDK